MKAGPFHISIGEYTTQVGEFSLMNADILAIADEIMSRKKRYASYRYRVGMITKANAPARCGFTRDHIVPVSFGFKHDIAPELIGSYDNIQYMTLNKNIEKGQRVTKEAIALLRKWGLDDLADVYEYKMSQW